LFVVSIKCIGAGANFRLGCVEFSVTQRTRLVLENQNGRPR